MAELTVEDRAVLSKLVISGASGAPPSSWAGQVSWRRGFHPRLCLDADIRGPRRSPRCRHVTLRAYLPPSIVACIDNTADQGVRSRPGNHWNDLGVWSLAAVADAVSRDDFDEHDVRDGHVSMAS